MKWLLALLVFSVLAMPTAVFAKGGKSNNRKGGVGYVYQDINAFSNPSNRGNTDGFTLQGAFESIASTPATYDANGSLTWGKKGFGFGAYYGRVGTNVLTTGTFAQTVGGNIGVNMFKDTVSFGAGYAYPLDATATTNGTATAALSIHSSKGEGANLTIGGTYTLNKVGAARMGAVVGLGWMMKNNLSIEVNGSVANINSISNYVGQFAINYSGRIVYLGAGFSYVAGGTHFATGRLGFNLGSHVDLSGMVNYFVRTTNALGYGGTVRFSF